MALARGYAMACHRIALVQITVFRMVIIIVIIIIGRFAKPPLDLTHHISTIRFPINK